MAEKNEVAQKQEFTTGLSQWTNTITGLVSRDFEQNGVKYDEYSKQCAMNAMGAIFQLVQNDDKADMGNLNTSNLREVVAQCASLKLNASAMPREVYFQLRNKQIGGQWCKVVEMGIEGDGNDSLLRQFGNNIDTVYPVWLVKEGDDFTYPRRRGIEIEPAEWTPKGLSDKTVRVVYPVKLKDGTIDYLIAEREPVRTNLIAHIRNNLLNETFGICENRYKATPKQKEQIRARKALYFHLSMRADDDGFLNNAKKVMKIIGANQNDYDLLVAKSFVIQFPDGICVIKHWRINNYLRKDRYTETIYQEEKSHLTVQPNGRYSFRNAVESSDVLPLGNSFSGYPA